MFVRITGYKTGSRWIITPTAYYMLRRIGDMYFFFIKSFKYDIITKLGIQIIRILYNIFIGRVRRQTAALQRRIEKNQLISRD